MAKNLFAYLFIIIISIPVILPAYISVLELNCEVSLIIDLDEEMEDIEITQDSELKIIPDFSIFLNYKYLIHQNEIIFIAKEYNAVFQNLESPPPDFYA